MSTWRWPSLPPFLTYLFLFSSRHWSCAHECAMLQMNREFNTAAQKFLAMLLGSWISCRCKACKCKHFTICWPVWKRTWTCANSNLTKICNIVWRSCMIHEGNTEEFLTPTSVAISCWSWGGGLLYLIRVFLVVKLEKYQGSASEFWFVLKYF